VAHEGGHRLRSIQRHRVIHGRFDPVARQELERALK